MKTTLADSVTPVERFLLRVDDSPWGELFRVGIGALIVPVASVWRVDESVWVLGAVLLGVLFSLRAAPAVARKLLPFSNTTLRVWRGRRKVAKRCDSYQWQKLFWIGMGLAIHILVSYRFPIAQLILTAMCLLFGGAGLLIWHIRSARFERARWAREPGLV